MSYLQNDNAMLENKQRELNGTIQSLLQSRKNFISVYEVGIFFFLLTTLFFICLLIRVKLNVTSELWHGPI